MGGSEKYWFVTAWRFGQCALTVFLRVWVSLIYKRLSTGVPAHQSIRPRPRHTCEQEHVSLSNAILHSSAARTKHTRTHVGPYSVGLMVVQWVVIGEYAMGWSLMDRSI